jgi:hypothetical protein
VTLALEGESPSGHPSTGNHGRDKPAVTRWLRLWGFESLPVHAPGNGLLPLSVRRKDAPVRLRAGVLMMRVSRVREAGCNPVVARVRVPGASPSARSQPDKAASS